MQECQLVPLVLSWRAFVWLDSEVSLRSKMGRRCNIGESLWDGAGSKTHWVPTFSMTEICLLKFGLVHV